MGIGANQYNNMYGYNPFGQFLSQMQPKPEPVQPSMVNDNIARAKAAYDAVLSGMSSNPAYNQSAMFPGLSSPSDIQLLQAPMNMSYGAGRFLSPTQGQQTGGVLGFNFNAPSMNKA